MERPLSRTLAGAVRQLALASLALVLTAEARAGDVPDLPEHPTLEDFLRVAELRNPGLESTRREWRAAAESIDEAGSFPDPRVSYSRFVEEVETRVGPQKDRFSLRQSVPWFGKLDLREEVASARAEAAGAGFEDRRLRLRRDVKVAWYDLYWLAEALRLTGENLDLLSELERVVREKYRTGTAEHADLVRIQIELGVLEDRLRSLNDRLPAIVARMNALLRRPPGAGIPLPESVPSLPPPPDRERVAAAIREVSPLVRAREHQVSGALARERLARRSRWPDWMVGVDWIRVDEALNPSVEDGGKDAFLVSVSVGLPIFRGKYDGPVREAGERLLAAKSKLDWEEDALLAEAEDVLFQWEDAVRRADLYENALLPKAEESLQATTTAYRTGNGGYLDLIEAQRTLLEFELEFERALADWGRSIARLEPITGVDWSKESVR